MSATSPAIEAIPLVRTSIYAALAPLMSAYPYTPPGGSASARLYWLLALQGAPRPLAIYQSQDAGGARNDYIGLAGWSGLITLKALADTASAAETLLGIMLPGMSSLAIPAGYTAGYSSISAVFERPVVIPPADAVWQAAVIYRVFLSR